MPTARKYQISLTETPYYHCISQCVRRAFLCGEDKYSGKNYDHRKQWIIERLKILANVFSIDVCAFAIMSNHHHLVLKVNANQAKHWTKDEVIKRWTQLFSARDLIQRYQIGAKLSDAQIEKVMELVEIWRERLFNISWFMRCLNEPIARRANAEDDCQGKFWSSRFKSQALLDEQAVLAGMIYVDLNPIRAGLCQNLESSEFTSIYQRIRKFSSNRLLSNTMENHSLKPTFQPTKYKKICEIRLAELTKNAQNLDAIPFSLEDYCELADWTGRAIREDKAGRIPSWEPRIITQLGINTKTWLETVSHFSDRFYTFIGPKEKLQQVCKRQKKKWIMGINICRKLFNPQNPITI